MGTTAKRWLVGLVLSFVLAVSCVTWSLGVALREPGGPSATLVGLGRATSPDGPIDAGIVRRYGHLSVYEDDFVVYDRKHTELGHGHTRWVKTEGVLKLAYRSTDPK